MNMKPIFRFRASKTTFLKEINTPSFIQRWQFVHDNGTLIINPAERTDAGTYRVEIHEESTGKGVGEHTVQLIIEGKSLHLASYALLDLTSPALSF